MDEWYTCQVCGYSTTDERRMHWTEEGITLCSDCEEEDLKESE